MLGSRKSAHRSLVRQLARSAAVLTLIMLMLAFSGAPGGALPLVPDQIDVQTMTGGFKLTNCPIRKVGYTTPGNTCTDTGFQVWSIPPTFNLNNSDACVNVNFYSTGGSAQGICSINDGTAAPNARRGSATATIYDPPHPTVGCGANLATWTVSWSGGSVYYVDSTGLSFRLSGTLSGKLYEHADGHDSWSLSGSLTGTMTQVGTTYTAAFTLNGTAQASANCDEGDEIRNFTFQLAGAATVTH